MRQKAETQTRQPQTQPPARQGGGVAMEPQQESRSAQFGQVSGSGSQAGGLGGFAGAIDGSPAVAAQRKLAGEIHNSSRQATAQKFSSGINNSRAMAAQRKKLGGLFGDAAQLRQQGGEASAGQLKEAPWSASGGAALPDNLKSGIENLSGLSMDGVNVHYNSAQPAQLNALAYAQGKDIFVGPGQEQHLPHEAWHVVQQAQGRVRPTLQMKEGIPLNDDNSLEREADIMGAQAVQMATAPARGMPLREVQGATGGGVVQGVISSAELKKIHSKNLFTMFKTTAYDEIIALTESFEKLNIPSDYVVSDELYKEAQRILYQIEATIGKWFQSSSRKDAQEKDKEKIDKLKYMKEVDIPLFKGWLKTPAMVEKEKVDAKAAAAEAKRKADEEAAAEAKRKAEEEAKKKAEEEARKKAEEEAKRKAEEEAQRKAVEGRIGAVKSGLYDAVTSQIAHQESISASNKAAAEKSRVDREKAAEDMKHDAEAQAEAEWTEALKKKYNAESDHKRRTQFKTVDAYIAHKKETEKEALATAKVEAVKKKQSDINKARDAKTFEDETRAAAEKEYDATTLASVRLGTKEEHVTAKLEEAYVADHTLREAVARSKDYKSRLEKNVTLINKHDPTKHESIKEAVKAFQLTIALGGVEDSDFSKTIGEGTFLIEKMDKKDSGVESDLKKKKATPEDWVNVSTLMNDSGEIHKLFTSIDAVKLGLYFPPHGEATISMFISKTVNSLSNQFLPEKHRRELVTREEKIIYDAWAQLMSEHAEVMDEERKASETSLVDKLVAKAKSLPEAMVENAGSISSAAGSGKKHVGVIGEDNEITKSVLGGVESGFGEVGKIFEIVKIAASDQEGKRKLSYTEIGAKIADASKPIAELLNFLGASISIPFVSDIAKVLSGLLRGLTFFQRWSKEGELVESQTKSGNQSGLLAAMSRTRKRNKTLMIYSAMDIFSGTFSLLGQILSAVPFANATLMAIGKVFDIAKTVHQVFESSYEAGQQQEAKLALEKGMDKAALGSMMQKSDDFAVTAIVMEAKNAVKRGEKNHVALQHLEAYGFDQKAIASVETKVLTTALLKLLERDKNAKTLWQKVQFWK